jgi:ATP-binding cassette, subfamily B, bacterial
LHKMIGFFKDWRKQSKYMAWLLRYTKPYFAQIFLLLIFDVAASLLTVGMAVLSKEIIDSATSGGIVKEAIVFYIAAIFVSMGITAFSNLISVIVNEKFSFGIRKQVYEKIMKSHWMDITKYHTGDLLTRMTSDAGNIADGIVVIIPTIIRLFIELAVTFFTLFYYEPKLAVFSLIMAPVVAMICFLLGRRLKRLQLKVQESEAAYRSFIQESLSNLLVVKSFTNEDYATDRLVKLRDDRFHWVFKRNRVNIASTTLMTFSFQMGYIFAFTYGALQLSKKAISYGMMSVFLTLVNRIQAPIMSLAQYIPRVVSILASAERIIELQDIELEEKKKVSIATEKVGVDISDLTFGYTDETVLDHVSLSIQPGEFVAIVGKSGIGKTTLVRLIMSFMSNLKGNIEFHNELGEKEKANASTREFIAYVPQGNTLFSGTIRENIRMGRLDATEEEMVEALKLAAGYEFVSNLPEGLDTVIGERGHGISEGQAQRIAIARALIRRAPFLIFDEATSALDERTELALLKNIQDIKPKPTCLLITHRRSVLKICDREICIDHKEIVNS